ncbi:xanthine dehydrogenase family protein molybdopterin-binding subunit [Leekyejoonella antrihumi]|nr:molybdopterin cofactor-binding domain-containing protein [Leekyejoonella antrihumi]
MRGLARYLDDIELPRMLHAAFVRSPMAHARVVQIDVEEVRGMPGVVGVFTHGDLAGVGPIQAIGPRPEIKSSLRAVLADGKVRFVGEAVAVVVAESRYIAEDACELVDVEYEQLRVVANARAALEPGAPILHADLGDNRISRIERSGGDIDHAFAAAAHVVKVSFHHGRVGALPLETRGVIGDWDAGTSTMRVWNSSQMPHLLRALIAAPLGLAETQLEVMVPAVGGAFGLKASVYPEDIVVPAVSRLVGRPVKWVEDRYENLAASSHAKEIDIDMEMAVAEDGTFLGVRAKNLSDPGAYSMPPFQAHHESLGSVNCMTGIYDIAAASYVAETALTNKAPLGVYRGVGWTPGQTVREVLVDDVARAIGRDPVELRLQNCIPDTPYDSVIGPRYDGGSYRRSLELATEMADYRGIRERQIEQRNQGKYVGVGVSPYVEPTGFGGRIGNELGYPGEYYDTASISIQADGSIYVMSGLNSQGQSHETTFAQLAADGIGARIEEVRVVQGDTKSTPFSAGVYASRSALIGAATIGRAAHEMKRRLVALAADMLEANVDDVEITHGKAFVRGAPEVVKTIADIAAYVHWGGGAAAVDLEEGALSVSSSAAPGGSYGNGCVVAVVVVDIETGKIQVEKVVSVEDCGTMLNPMIVEGQVAGAVAQGIGDALLEEHQYNEDGAFMSASLLDYLYPSTMEIPDIAIGHLETPAPGVPGGFKGLGEAGVIATPGAVLNAVADALSPFGVRVHSTPLGPSKVLDLIDEAREAMSGSA